MTLSYYLTTISRRCEGLPAYQLRCVVAITCKWPGAAGSDHVDAQRVAVATRTAAGARALMPYRGLYISIVNNIGLSRHHYSRSCISRRTDRQTRTGRYLLAGESVMFPHAGQVHLLYRSTGSDDTRDSPSSAVTGQSDLSKWRTLLQCITKGKRCIPHF
ncbi:hypothetical protein J6590_011970 [Homalodisca vitripennis]|nr:hypothetical protein J6590_011970 [Homalodisca vitripennis]